LSGLNWMLNHAFRLFVCIISFNWNYLNKFLRRSVTFSE
jgi:hypothetical protein